MATSGLPAIPSLDNTYGAIFIGMVIAAGLWGITTAQTYWYYTTYQKDPIGWKLLVATVWTLDTVHQALISYLIYQYMITHYFDPLALDQVIPTFSIQAVFEIAPTFFVQCFFLMRIWRLSRGKFKWVLILLPSVFIAGKLVVGLVWVARVVTRTSVTDSNARDGQLVKWAQGSAMAADVLLAGTMVFLLYSSRTGMSHTNMTINKLMLYAINTGVVTGLCAIATLVCVVAFPNTFIYGLFYFCIGRLYVNSMLASLNARKNLMNQTTFLEMSLSGDLGTHTADQTLQTRGGTKGSISGSAAFEESSKLGVYINTTRATRHDAAV
ncbi:unnamed protein product [Cyclocybe aegerita]|uniref:DUF6534 domain-containing protein n=1 Tax=Cyclocybe aegerita TaxID=1973307 RepID=A0A8S0WRE8_CYCAE|nr:unnamed protein product [Cyclocybe aegerita]